ncbi:hypothetical protein I4U23_023545 [Adineta vaga]|nr:hypothetical protein I4U23_023545 [Adineta vaga]
MYFIHLISFASWIILVSSFSIGRVAKARLLPTSQNQTIWLYNQTNANQCLCSVWKLYPLSQVAALNSFSTNASCQVILSSTILSPRIVSDSKSNLILLKLLTDTPCCTDLAWVIERLKLTLRQSQTTVSKPTTLSLDSTEKFVSTMTYRSRLLFRLYRNNLTQEGIYQLPSSYVCVSAIYRKGYIFFGCDTPAALVIFNESNLATPVAQISLYMYIRAVSFARNDSLMFVTVQRGTYSMYIYNITWIPTISTTLIQTFIPTSNQTWSAHTINDSYVIMTSWDPATQLYALTSSSSTSNVWSRTSLTTTRIKSSEYLGEAISDSCGRIWIVINGFGIRIFDPSITTILVNWTLSTTLSNILLFDDYELFLTDYTQNSVYRFSPNLQCTS